MVFEDITLQWQGKEKTIKANSVMMMLAKMEDIITLAELGSHQQRGGSPMVKLAMAYGVALRYAGFAVADDEVYTAMFKDGDGGFGVRQAVVALQSMMIPPEHLRGNADDAPSAAGTEPEKTEPATS